MSDLSDSIKTTFKNLITIYQETANLLEDASSILEKSGYRCVHGNTVGTEQSKNINTPSWWITPYASRYFATQENPAEIKALGVFFVDKNYTPIEPLVLIGCFRMKKNEKDEFSQVYYSALKEAWFSLVPKRKMRTDLNFKGKSNFDSGKIRAVPLDDINDQKTLEKNVIVPLLDISC